MRAQRASKGGGPARSPFEARAQNGALALQDDGERDRQRIDKWLWHARVVRTRTDAAALIEAGRVRLNGQRTRAPAHLVRSGDVVTIALDGAVRVLEVAGFCERRGNATDARALYRDVDGGARKEGR